jgi:hypothetical protein
MKKQISPIVANLIEAENAAAEAHTIVNNFSVEGGETYGAVPAIRNAVQEIGFAKTKIEKLERDLALAQGRAISQFCQRQDAVNVAHELYHATEALKDAPSALGVDADGALARYDAALAAVGELSLEQLAQG